MKNNILFIFVFILIALGQSSQVYANTIGNHSRYKVFEINTNATILTDTVPPADVMEIVKKAIYALNTFNIDDVADLYTPNAVIADDEPPYSWNGPTAGVQWVNAVEKVCKDFKITKLKGNIEAINVFQQNTDNIYIVVPVSYTGNMPGKAHFTAKGAFTFVLRTENGKWMIKTQTWMPGKGM